MMDWSKFTLNMNTVLHFGILLGVLDISHGRIGFKKDQSTDVQFPPRLPKPVDGIPTGHLRPLGKSNVRLTNLRGPLGV